ncbi:MAG: response regulator [Gammaproteobacteria bacterium]|nr:response regulator [Gammaproteobacteria bacterium]
MGSTQADQATMSRVMVIDDEVIITGFLRTLLEKRGYHVKIFNDPIAALRQFETASDEIDVVISDQTMPGMTGSELAIAMLALRPDLPFILCTGYSETIDEQRAKALNISSFLQKPYDSSTLLAKLNDAMNNQRR